MARKERPLLLLPPFNHYEVTDDPPYVLRIEYRLLVSGGFDFDVIIWNPYVEHLILRLSGHSNSICGVEARTFVSGMTVCVCVSHTDSAA